MKIVVTGGNGFLGRHLISELRQNGYTDIYPVLSRAYDLRRQAHIDALFKHTGKVDVLFHLAARVGGIGDNRLHPGQYFYENMLMGLQVIHTALQRAVGKIIMTGTTCSYPKLATIPFRETSLYDGFPEETNASYGIAKRALLVMLKAYQLEYNTRYTYLIPTNLYGPGDNFDENTSHVIPALIKKCIEAKRKNQSGITVWGTGKATRDFLYVTDAAKALVLAMEKYEGSEPLNIGSGNEINISTLVYFIKQATGFNGQTEYDTSKPDGQPRRVLDITNAEDALGWKPQVDLAEGLKETVEWYEGEL